MASVSSKKTTDKFFTLEGKVTLLTGASSGIGEVTARVFAKLGAKLVITGRDKQSLERVATECEAQPGAVGKPVIVVADLNKDEDVKILMESTLKAYGKLDILINNAGIYEPGDIDNTSIEQFDRIFQTNVRGLYLLSILAVPHLTKTKGNIVNISSVYGTIAVPGSLAYCMTKSALNQFTKCLSIGLAGRGVRVNSVNPGFVATDIFRRAGLNPAGVQQVLTRATEVHPMPRLGECEEVANAIAFLASDTASFTTGELLHVDGGYHNHFLHH